MSKSCHDVRNKTQTVQACDSQPPATTKHPFTHPSSDFSPFPLPQGPHGSQVWSATLSWTPDSHTLPGRGQHWKGGGCSGTKTLAMIMLTLSSAPSLVTDGAKLHLRHTQAFPTSSGPREKRALSQASKCQQERQEAQGKACSRGGGDFFWVTFTHDNDWLLWRKCFTSTNP